ncbi:c-type cytochrome [Rhodobacteraceae bacterium NNCM2]|nr:c-type cytochrome [Coraliihabitans acroporae]
MHKTIVPLCLAMLMPAGALSAAEALSPYTISNGISIDAPLGGAAGNWERGRTIYFDRSLTGCSACHGSPGGPGAEIVKGSENAPSLTGIASRLSEGEIRLWIVAPKVLNPESEMPGFYLAGQRSGPDSPVINGPWLDAGQIEDLVAYLARQKSGE